eukprot:TRINITY_DN3298_c0_g1_i1.p1 TRINITY_DN3298_c0_g1~~TRINITY_DN3298_c0_g1_i1.p1  ORF type:complete len:281 (-),score=82.35 TRINITY_DN3298_c0_g1_i1:30-872(-)
MFRLKGIQKLKEFWRSFKSFGEDQMNTVNEHREFIKKGQEELKRLMDETTKKNNETVEKLMGKAGQEIEEAKQLSNNPPFSVMDNLGLSPDMMKFLKENNYDLKPGKNLLEQIDEMKADFSKKQAESRLEGMPDIEGMMSMMKESMMKDGKRPNVFQMFKRFRQVQEFSKQIEQGKIPDRESAKKFLAELGVNMDDLPNMKQTDFVETIRKNIMEEQLRPQPQINVEQNARKEADTVKITEDIKIVEQTIIKMQPDNTTQNTTSNTTSTAQTDINDNKKI